MQAFEAVVRIIHIGASYWGECDVTVIKKGFEHARFVIEKLTEGRVL